jgi:excisionase family DNA binding protein
MKLSTKEFAERVGLTRPRINQMIQNGEIDAEKLGRDFFIDEKFVEIIRNRPERRGRPKKIKEVTI